jgi:hypothetical protein
MTKTCCDRCSFPGPMRWLHAGRDLSRPNGIHQRADRTLRRFEHPPKCLMLSADLPYVQTPSSNPANVTLIAMDHGQKSLAARNGWRSYQRVVQQPSKVCRA